MRERAAVARQSLPSALSELRAVPNVEACAILSTCNRIELYAVLREHASGMEALNRFLAERAGVSIAELASHRYIRTRSHAARHLFRVAAGLESMVLGEDQILAQVKEAYAAVLTAQCGDAVLHELFLRAIQVGKRVRTETGIARHPASLSSLAVELCSVELDGLQGRHVVVLGAGEMARLAVENLTARCAARVTVVNRSVEHARTLVEGVARKQQTQGGALGIASLDTLAEQLHTADALITATAAPAWLVDAETLYTVTQHRGGEQFVVIDLGLPRDVEPGAENLDGVRVYRIDSLRTIAAENRRARAGHLEQAARIVDAALPEFLEWLEARYVVPTVSALQRRGREVLERELQRAINRLDDELGAREHRVLREMGDSIVRQLVNTPISRLKQQSAVGEGRLYAEIACELFGLRPETEAEHEDEPAAGTDRGHDSA